MKEQDIQCVNEIKVLALDMINQAKSGHPGIVLSGAPILYTLFAKHLRFNKENLNWIDRDRFIISSGHGSALLYATMYMAGFPISKEDLIKFRRIDSKATGHPERGLIPGIEVSTGVLGEGISMGVGVALGRRYLQSILKNEEEDPSLIDYYTYVYVGDGDLMEGVSYEALSFAGTQKLDHLILLYDANHMSADGNTNRDFTENIEKRFLSMGFDVFYVSKGAEVKEIDKQISKAKKTKKPAIIIIKTILGQGSLNQDTKFVHGKPLMDDDFYQLRTKLNVTTPPFTITKDSFLYMENSITSRMKKEYDEWLTLYNRIASNTSTPKLKELIKMIEEENIHIPFDSANYKIAENYQEDMRESNYKVMNLFASKTPFFLGGSADLATSCRTVINNSEEMSFEHPAQKNIAFGVREHAMAGILNGLASLGLRTFGSTMLTFSDHMRPSIRMSALMNLPVLYIFTHDSIRIGEDGPTHEPIEQLSSLRLIPNLVVMRPCDIMELMGCYELYLQNNHPVALILNKSNIPKLSMTNSKKVLKGAYIVKQEKYPLKAILIATGEEVHVALRSATELESQNMGIRVVSMPSMEVFLKQGVAYEEEVLPKGVKKIVIEAGSGLIWNRFVENSENIIALDDFGFSGTSQEVLKKMNFDEESILMKIRRLLGI